VSADVNEMNLHHAPEKIHRMNAIMASMPGMMCVWLQRKNHIIRNRDDDDSNVRGLILSRDSIDQEATGLTYK
jgi:hypothetical protein